MTQFNQAAASGKETCAQNKGQPHHRASHTTHGHFNTESSFLDAMHASGCAPADASAVVADGLLHRYRIDDDKSNSKNGWFILFGDGLPSGAFGSWKLGLSEQWSAKGFNTLTPSERDAQRRRIEAAREAAKALQEQAHKTAAERALQLWSNAKPANPSHLYLVRKQIKPGIARQMNDVLVLPIQSDNGLVGLQFIQPDGTKRMLSGTAKTGHFIVTAQGNGQGHVLVCEGWATAMTLAALEPEALVLAAIDAGNLQPVALAVRKMHPDAELVICADNDRKSTTNVGLIKARAAAIASGAKIIIPEFPEHAPPELSDFNDLVNFLKGGAA